MYPYRRYRIRHWIKIGIGAAIALLAAVAIGLVIEVGTGPHRTPAYTPPTVPNLFSGYGATPSPTVSAAEPAPAQPALSGPMQVIPGRVLVNGVYLGYPHSTEGAVSAADQFATQLGSTLDPDRVAAVMRMTGDPSYPQGPQDFAQGLVSTRQGLGIPASGPVADGTSLVLEPVEYQVRDVTADQVSVLLLSDLVITLPAQGTQTRIAVYPLRMHWAQDDWKILAPDNASYLKLAAEPGSPQAASDGWQELTP
jgi:hypothetical protein